MVSSKHTGMFGRYIPVCFLETIQMVSWGDGGGFKGGMEVQDSGVELTECFVFCFMFS